MSVAFTIDLGLTNADEPLKFGGDDGGIRLVADSPDDVLDALAYRVETAIHLSVEFPDSCRICALLDPFEARSHTTADHRPLPIGTDGAYEERVSQKVIKGISHN